MPLALGVPYSAVAATDASAACPASTLHTASFFRWPMATAEGATPNSSAANAWMSADRYPRGTEAGVDVAGQHVFGLHRLQGLGVAGVGRARGLGGWPASSRTLPDR